MDFYDLKNAVTCLKKIIPGAVIQYCNNNEAKELSIVLLNRNLSDSFHTLIIDCGKLTSGVFYELTSAHKNTSSGLARSFSKKLHGANIVSVNMPYPDRVVTVELQLKEWPSNRELWLEFCGINSNVSLIDGSNNEILECLTKFPESLEDRPVRMPGRRFQSFWDTRKKGVKPLEDLIDSTEQITQVLQQDAPRKFLLNNYAPITPTLADKLLQSLDQPGSDKLQSIIARFMNASELTDASANEALSYLNKVSTERQDKKRHIHFTTSKRRLLKVLDTALNRINRSKSKLHSDLDQLPDPDIARRKADLLAMNFHLIKSGMSQIQLPDVLETGSPSCLIQLDPAKTPQKNLDALYKKAGKIARSVPKINKRLQQLDQESHMLSEMMQKLHQAEHDDTLNHIADQLRNAGLLTAQSTKASTKAMLSKKPYHRFVTKDGFQIYVGRNAVENAMLSFQDASPHDFWLHAKGYQGAHVILKNPGKLTEAPTNAITYAARLAVYYSKARNEKRIPVIVTQKKNVRAASGKNPGLARVFRHKTLTVDSL